MKPAAKLSWKTTLGGILATLGQFLATTLNPEYFWVANAVTGLGTLLIGFAARDNNVTSTEVKIANEQK